MDKKTFLVLLYLTAFLPISYMIGQLYLPNRGWIGIGLLNMIVLLLMFLLFGTPRDNTHPKKKKFGLILISLLIGAMLFSGAIDGALVKGSLRLHKMINSTSVIAPTTGEVISENNSALTIPEFSSTGDQEVVQTGIDTLPIKTGAVILESDDETLPKEPLTDQTAIKTVTKETQETTTSSYSSSSYGSVIPYLVSHFGLKNTKKSYPKFSFVSVKSSLYSSFATAYSKGMIGTSINPSTKVSCDTYIVLKGIAAGWKVSYTGKPFAAYRAEAESRGAVNGCNSGLYVTSKTL